MEGPCGQLPPGVAKACGILDRRWAPQVLWVLMQQPTHFNGLLKTIPGISREMLRNRLRDLRVAGLITKRDGPAMMKIYELTALGEGLRATLAGITTWGAEQEALG